MMHVVKVEFCKAQHLNVVHFSRRRRKAYANQFIPWALLCSIGLASLESKEEVKENVLLHSHRLTVNLAEEIKLPSPLALRLTTSTGQQFLLGAAHRPFVDASQAINFTARPSERSGVTLTVSYTGREPLFEFLEE